MIRRLLRRLRQPAPRSGGVLSGAEIQREVMRGNIRIDPFDHQYLGPNSYDLHLGDQLLRYDMKDVAIDTRNPPDTQVVEMLDHGSFPNIEPGWLLIPGILYLGATREYTETWGFVPYIDGRSSLGRVGVFAHVTAGRGDNGFCGNWTVELVATHPTIVYPGQRLFQITYHTVVGDHIHYGETLNSSGRYQGDRSPQPVKL